MRENLRLASSKSSMSHQTRDTYVNKQLDKFQRANCLRTLHITIAERAFSATYCAIEDRALFQIFVCALTPAASKMQARKFDFFAPRPIYQRKDNTYSRERQAQITLRVLVALIFSLRRAQ